MLFLRRNLLLTLLLLAFSVLANLQAENLRVVVFADKGSGKKGIANVTEQLRGEGMEVVHLNGKEIAEGRLDGFDAVVFTGGSGGGQARSLGEEGRENVRQFVARGNGYVGICAGAYLACSGFSWGIGVLDAKTVSQKWRRGKGEIEVEVLPEGTEVSGLAPQTHKIRYANGPILTPHGRDDLPDFETVAFFRSEISENGTPEGIMINSPAIARSSFGEGRVVVSSPHPESTEGLAPVFAPAAVRWATANISSKNAAKSSSKDE